LIKVSKRVKACQGVSRHLELSRHLDQGVEADK